MLLDFAKAFAKEMIKGNLEMARLVQQLYSIDLINTFIKFIPANLTNRQQYVEISGRSSGGLPVTSGVPRRVWVGYYPILVYINDSASVVNLHISSNVFADDCCIP